MPPLALRPAQLGKLTNLVQRGCYLQNNSFYFCGPPAPPAGTEITGNPLIPTECTTDGPVSPTDWIGPGAIYCENVTQDGGGGNNNDQGDKEYSAGALYAAPPRGTHRALPLPPPSPVVPHRTRRRVCAER